MRRRLFNLFFPVNNIDNNEIPRNKWLEDRLKKLPAQWRLLDAGAGEQAKKKYCSHLQYVSQDFAQYDGQGDGIGLHTGSWEQSSLDIVSDICAIPEPDKSFDAILCAEVFEHLPAPHDALKEFSRLLRPEGELILTAPFCACTHFAPYFFQTGFSPYWYKRHLIQNGFEIKEIQANGNFSAYLLQEIKRAPSIAEKYIAIKPTIFEKVGLRLTQSFLSRMLENDTKSDEFLCFGYHVHAIKK